MVTAAGRVPVGSPGGVTQETIVGDKKVALRARPPMRHWRLLEGRKPAPWMVTDTPPFVLTTEGLTEATMNAPASMKV